MSETAGMHGFLPLAVEIDGRSARPQDTEYSWSGHRLVLTLTTILPLPSGEALELVSTYTGHPDTDTIATHLLVHGALDADVQTLSYPAAELNTAQLVRGCGYEHLEWLLEAIQSLGHQARVHVLEDTFTALENIGQPAL